MSDENLEVEQAVDENTTEQVEQPVEENVEQPSTDEIVEEPKYEPDFTYKANKEKREFDEWLRGAVTNKEQEDHLRRLYQKADGLESIEKSYDEFRDYVQTEYDPIIQDYNELAEIEQNIQTAIINNDMHAVKQNLGLTDEQWLQHAKDILDYQEMDPTQRQQLDSQRKIAEQNAMYQNQFSEIEAQQEQLAIENRHLQLDRELIKQDVNSFQEKFDAAAGKEGAFKNAVINTGTQAFYQYGVDLSPAEAIELVMQDYGGFVNNMGTQTPQVQQPQNQMQQPVEKPTLPNMGSGGSKSPTKRVVNSLDDIRAINKQRGLA